MVFEDRASVDIETFLTGDVGWTASVFGYWVIEGCKSEEEAIEQAMKFVRECVNERIMENN